MLKALLKKQFWETASFFFLNSKDGKRRSTGAIVGFALLMLYAFGAVVAMFTMLSWTLCAPFVQNGLSWVYFAFMATLATSFSVIGSVFSAKSKLFEAKDNELLLSMPLPSWAILFTRMTGLYAMAFLFEAIVFVPAVVVYFIVAGFSMLPALFCLLLIFLMPFGVLAISSLLGWLIALITARFPAKNLITVLLLFAFFALYTVAYTKINEALNFILANGAAVGNVMQTWLFPFYLIGLAATGNALGFLGFFAIFGGVFALAYLLLSATFFRVVTMKRGGVQTKYKERTIKRTSAFSALLRKELARLKNPMILFNAALGSILFLVLCVFALFNTELCNEIVRSGVEKGEVAVILAVILCFIASSNMLTASSVSLEGETLWILRSSPVATKEIFAAKIATHALVTALPAAIAAAVVCALLKIPVGLAALVLFTVLAITVLCATAGLAINLKMPNLTWTNEVAVVKQSLSTMLGMFAGWGASALVIIGHFAFGKYLPAAGYLTIVGALFVVLAVPLILWLLKRGVKIFERL
ncbi:MAG: ABC transporter permease [Clostridia bacterium]|nr:ABC transporter permease [Clostridia bacterium]